MHNFESTVTGTMYKKKTVWIFINLCLLFGGTSIISVESVVGEVVGSINKEKHNSSDHDNVAQTSPKGSSQCNEISSGPQAGDTVRELIRRGHRKVEYSDLTASSNNGVSDLEDLTEHRSGRSVYLGGFDGCSDHGSCYRQGKDFFCCCQSGYTGQHCEFEISTDTTTVVFTPTETRPSEAHPTETRPSETLPCVPVNDCTAHFTCNNDDSRKCLQGWTGENCDQQIPNSAADCTIYDYDNSFITSEWNGTYDCGKNDSEVGYILNITTSSSVLTGTLTTEHFTAPLTGSYVSFNKFLILTTSDKILENNLTGVSINMYLNSSVVLTGVVHFYANGDGEARNCKSELHRSAAYFSGCSFHGDCYRYGRNKKDFSCCCKQGFEGQFCEKTICVPVNNCSAHYTCNSDGSKKCLDGWDGENCDQLIDNSVADCSFYDFGTNTTPNSILTTSTSGITRAVMPSTTKGQRITDCQNLPLKSNATVEYTLLNGVKHARILCRNETGNLVQDNMYCDNGTWTINNTPHCLIAYNLITETLFPQTKQSIYRPTLNPFPSNGSKALLCPVIASIDNGKVMVTGTIVSFTCEQGHNLLGSPRLQCINGRWNSSVPFCSECRGLASLPNGRVGYTSGQTFDIASFSCDDGYSITGASVAYCLNGRWSETTPTCTRSASGCSLLNGIQNGMVKMHGFSNGSSAEYECYQGYYLVGVVIRHCIDGRWTDEEPICKVIDCGPPADLENGEVTIIGGTNYGGLAVYTCNIGYYTNDTKSSVCKENGSWLNRVPRCHIIDCGSLKAPLDGSVQYENTDHIRTGYHSLATYSCSPGFSLVGFTSRVCLDSGKWSGTSPKCIKSTPNKKPCRGETDAWGTTWPEALPGQTSSFQCKGGDTIGKNIAYRPRKFFVFGSFICPAKPDGAITRNCSMTGEWGLPIYSCVRRDIANVRQQVEELHSYPSSVGVSHALEQLASLTSVVNDSGVLHAGELESITDSLEIITTIADSDMFLTEEQSQTYIKTANNMFNKRNAQSWQALSQTQDARGAARVLQCIDKFSVAMTKSLEIGNKSQITFVQSNIVLEVKKISQDQTRVAFPDYSDRPDGEERSGSGFVLPIQPNTGLKVKSYTGVFYRDLANIFPNRSLALGGNDSQFDSDKTLNSPVLSLQLFPDQHNLSLPLELTFTHQKENFRNATCSYWNFDRNLWETEGCHIRSSGHSVTVCECNHLTNFAVLMSPWNAASESSTAIEIISIVGCGVSLVCLLTTLSAHLMVWRYVKSDRVIILINLCLALIVSYVTFLAGINQTQNKAVCIAVAALLQYIYLVVFFLMLAEGIETAITVLYVFSTKSRIRWMLPAAWGIPATIVGISLGVTKLKGYGTKDFCWLSVENGLIWAFVGPAVFIILVNVILLILVLRAMLSSKAVSEKTEKEKLKCSVRCLCVLLPLMGCTWVLGIFYVNERMIWIQYLFAICNSLQGFFIFLFHGFLNKQLRIAIKRRHKKYKDSVTTSKELSSKPRETKRDKPLFQSNGEVYSEPVHLLSFEKRRSIQTRKITF